MPKHNWNFKAKVKKIIDGDTVKFIIDRGFYDYSVMNIRLARIDAPEKRKGETEGFAAKEWLELLIPVGATVLLQTFKHGKYRWVAELYIQDANGEFTKNISDELVKAGHAIYKDY